MYPTRGAVATDDISGCTGGNDPHHRRQVPAITTEMSLATTAAISIASIQPAVSDVQTIAPHYVSPYLKKLTSQKWDVAKSTGSLSARRINSSSYRWRDATRQRAAHMKMPQTFPFSLFFLELEIARPYIQAPSFASQLRRFTFD